MESLSRVRETDGQLVGRFAADGDEAAFAELVRRHGPMVFAAARRRLPDPADAADVFQATFLVLVRKANRLDGRPSLAPWLYRVAALTARNVRRRNARRPGRLADVPTDATDPTLKWALDDALLGLPDRDRSAVVLCHLLGYSRREAADRLGLPEGTLSAVLHRALTRLRRTLGTDPHALFVGGLVPAGLATATTRVAVAVRAAAPSAPLAVGGVTAGKLLLAGIMATGVGLGAGWSVPRSPAPVPSAAMSATVSVRVVGSPVPGLEWADGASTPVRLAGPHELRMLLARPPAERIDLTADADAPPGLLLLAAEAFAAVDRTLLRYTGPTPMMSESLGTVTHDWGKLVDLGPALLHLPTAFGLCPPPEARAVAAVVTRGGAVTRDLSLPGRPVVGLRLPGASDAAVAELAPLGRLASMELAGPLTDSGLSGLLNFPHLRTADLSGCPAVTAAGVVALRSARPDCVVRR